MKRCSLVSVGGFCRAWLVGLLWCGIPLVPSLFGAEAPAPLSQLTELIALSPDTGVRLDILRGISAALQGQRSVPMPSGWSAVEETLSTSDNTEVRSLAQSLGLTFGSQKAMAALRSTA